MLARATILMSVAWALASASLVAAFAIPEGGEFHVNSYTTDYQILPDVCGHDDGTFVVTWSSYSQDGDGFGVFGQRFASDGMTLGPEFQANSTSAGSQFQPRSCCSDNGFVVVWSFQPDADGSGVFGQRFNTNGVALGTEFQANSFTTGDQYSTDVCCATDGSFVVVWRDEDARDGDSGGIFGQRFDSMGAAVGTDFQVNTYTTDDQQAPSVSCDSSGSFVVAWVGGPTFNDTEISARRYDSAGLPQGNQFQVNSFTTDTQRYPGVCHDAGGGFVIVWSSRLFQGPFSNDIVAQRYDSSGVAVGTEFAVNEPELGAGDPDVSCGDAGDFQVVWSGADPISLYEVTTRARRVDASGTPLGSSFIVSTSRLNYQNQAAIGRTGNDGFVVAWRSTYQEAPGDYGGIYAQRVRVSATTTTTLAFGGYGSRDGGEFQINTFTTQNQFGTAARAVARSNDGRFLVTWTTEGRQEGAAAIDGSAVIARLFEIDGTPASAEFLVNTYTTRNQLDPTVAASGDGFVIAWQGYGGLAVDPSGVFARVLDGDATFLTSSFLVNSYTTGFQGSASVGGAADGSFLVMWENADGSGTGLFGQRYDAAAARVGAEFSINTFTTGDQERANLSMTPSGDFVVVWQDDSGRDGDGFAIVGQRFDNTATFVGTDFVVNTYSTAGQFTPSVAMDAAGNFVVVYDSAYEAGTYLFGSGIRGQRFGSDGSTLGTEFDVNSFMPSYQRNADVAIDAEGYFMVVWRTEYLDGDGYALAGRLFDPTGNPLGDDIQVNSYATDDQGTRPSVASDAAGNFVVVWNSDQQDGLRDGMFGQTFCRDLDGDTICDRIICERTGSPGEQEISEKSKLVLAKINSDTTAGNDKIVLKGALTLPLSTGFAQLDPGAEGLRLLLIAADGTTRTDETLPAGAAWSLNRAGNKWSYKDKTGSVNGIIKAQIKDRRKKSPNQVQVIVKGKNGTYPIVAGDEPVQATVVLGDATAAVAFECGETAFASEDCKFNGSANKLSCKR